MLSAVLTARLWIVRTARLFTLPLTLRRTFARFVAALSRAFLCSRIVTCAGRRLAGAALRRLAGAFVGRLILPVATGAFARRALAGTLFAAARAVAALLALRIVLALAAPAGGGVLLAGLILPGRPLLPLVAGLHVGLRFGGTLRILRLLAVAGFPLICAALLLPFGASRGVLAPVLRALFLFTLFIQLPVALQELFDSLKRFPIVLTIGRHRRLLARLRNLTIARLTLIVATSLVAPLTAFLLCFAAALSAACVFASTTVRTRLTLRCLRVALLLPTGLPIARRLLRIVAGGLATDGFAAGGFAALIAMLATARLLLAVARLLALFAGGRLAARTLLAAGFALGRLCVGGVALLLLLLVAGLLLLVIAGLAAR